MYIFELDDDLVHCTYISEEKNAFRDYHSFAERLGVQRSDLSPDAFLSWFAVNKNGKGGRKKLCQFCFVGILC